MLVAHESYRLRRDATLIAADDDGGLTMRQSRFQIRLERLGVGRRALLMRVAEQWISDADAHRVVATLEGEGRVLAAQVLLRRLLAHSWLERRLQLGPRPLLDVLPRGLGAGTQPEPRRHDEALAYRLSRFACLRASDGRMVAASPLSTVAIGCADARLASALATAATDGIDRAGLADLLGVDPATAGRVLDELLSAGVLLTPAEHHDERAEPRLAYWEPEELAVHDRSRPGRHAHPVGGTYPFRDRFPPLRPARCGTRSVPLPVPDPDLVAKNDDTLTHLMAARRSVREHDDDNPITIDQLAEFLYRVQFTTDAHPSGGDEVGRRPYPSGGGLCELEVYPLVTRCCGLAPGLYHYDSHEHRLELIADRGAVDSRVVRYARGAGVMTGTPQVVLVMTARVQRLMWKYEGLGYPLALKNAGVLTGLMYLVATAMGLAPCAIGAGDSAAFAALSGLDPLVEPNIADFLLGSRSPAPEGSTPPGTEERCP
jgi:SagB-type dehydrogenase family enzyme